MKDAFSPTYQTVELIPGRNEKLYIRTENWGVTGDSQLTIITTENNGDFEIDSSKQIIFKGLEPFIYRVSGDTLFLVLRHEGKIPAGFGSTWKIIQKEVDNPMMMNTRRVDRYKGI